MIFDSHAHYDDEAFDEDREELFASMLGIDYGKVGKIVGIGADLATSEAELALARAHDEIAVAVGIHPDEVQDLPDDYIDKLKAMADDENVVAIGEIGLDYYHTRDADKRLIQKDRFIEQLELAWELNLPIVVHSRDAAADTLSVIKEFCATHPINEDIIRGVIHCFSYSKEIAAEYIKLGFVIGVGGVLTFKKARNLVETVEAIDISKILVETDAPYLAPEPYRGKRNNSSYISYVIDKIAEIKHLSPQEVEDITYNNAAKMYFGR